MWTFATLSVLGASVLAWGAARRGGRRVGVALGAILGMHALLATGWVAAAPAEVRPLAWLFQLQTFIFVAAGLRPRMPSTAWNALVVWPACVFIAGTWVALPWTVAALLGLPLPAPWLPYALAAFGLYQSVSTRRDGLTLYLRAAVPPAAGPARRAPALLTRGPWPEHPPGPGPRALRIVQISDPHLGPFMSVARLRRICARAVAAEPDLILLTGDLLTLASQTEPGLLAQALAPLGTHPRVFAVPGNHDHETPRLVADGLAAVGARLLVDARVRVETPAGPVELVGVDYRWWNRRAELGPLFAGWPRERLPGDALLPRILLLHDPGMFRFVPAGAADLTLSGHTHGGHVGLWSLGLPWTAVGLLARIPDHGPWVGPAGALYVHRATGHYGFPLRLGVPAEESVMHVHFSTGPA